MDEPIAIPLPLPHDYGKATKPMAWSEADRLLTESRVYWIATTRPDGRPHVVPSDGVWLDGALYSAAPRRRYTCATSVRRATPSRTSAMD